MMIWTHAVKYKVNKDGCLVCLVMQKPCSFLQWKLVNTCNCSSIEQSVA